LTLVLEIGRRIDELLGTADRSQLVRLLATLKHREVLILEALHPSAAARPAAEGLVALADVASAFRVSTRTAYRMARVAPLRDYAVWSSPRRLRGFLPGVRSVLPRHEPRG
jgi:hypothetical protein